MNSLPHSIIVATLALIALSPELQVQERAQRAIQVEELPFGTMVTTALDDQDRRIVVLPFGSVLRSSIWPELVIPVCWENPAATTPAYRQLVQAAVAGSWQKESRLQFTGWQTCSSQSRGLRISVSDEGPHTKALGRYLDARPNGVVLNFTFERWSPNCQQNVEFCAWALAVHEFGHAIGFAHEQNRADAPFECQLDAQGTTGDWNLTLYDPSSVMNYCNVEWNNSGRLSDRDILAVRTIYGSPL